MNVCCKSLKYKTIWGVFLDSKFFTMSLSYEGGKKLKQTIRAVINRYVFLNQFRTESLSG